MLSFKEHSLTVWQGRNAGWLTSSTLLLNVLYPQTIRAAPPLAPGMLPSYAADVRG